MLTCNWLHGGLLHLGMNMLALRNLGVPLERSFGPWRIGRYYYTLCTHFTRAHTEATAESTHVDHVE